jgi:hypothetical protein
VSGICSQHQVRDPDCSLCTSTPFSAVDRAYCRGWEDSRVEMIRNHWTPVENCVLNIYTKLEDAARKSIAEVVDPALEEALGEIDKQRELNRGVWERDLPRAGVGHVAWLETPWDAEEWREHGPECTRCNTMLGWEGDLPETEEDAICSDCAWAELDALRIAMRAHNPIVSGNCLKIEAAISLLRGAFRDDGAEGESVHIVCNELEAALKANAHLRRKD